MNFILIHGSWHTGEAWHDVAARLTAVGHSVYTPTLSGMTSREHPGGPEINVSTHIQDIVNLIEAHDLRDVILVGHSYSGFVTTGVADRMPERIAKIISLDAFTPDNNQSLFDIMGAESEAGMRAGLVNDAGLSKADGAEQVWLLPPGDARFYLGESADDSLVGWLQARLVYKPVETFAEKLTFDVARVRAIPSYHITCTQFEYLHWLAEKAHGLGRPVYEVDTGHDAMLTEPAEVARIFDEIARG